MEEAIVLYPAQGVGHFISMVEFGKLLLKYHPSLSIKIIAYTEPNSTSEYIAAVSATVPSIAFHPLPPISLPPEFSFTNPVDLLYEIPLLNNPNLYNALQTISNTCQIKAFVLDFFNDSAFEVTDQLNIPTYYFFTNSASGLAVLLYFPTIYHSTTKSFKDLNTTLLEIPGWPPFPASCMPTDTQHRDSKTNKRFLETAYQMRKSKGIVINSFEFLEQGAASAISQGLNVPDGQTPPIYCVGPLISRNQRIFTDPAGSTQQEDMCLSWLSQQPSQSVVFLSFGSLGRFSAKQLKEIAIGLENSGLKFLWVVRRPLPDSETQSVRSKAEDQMNLDELMPEGFIERTKERGLIVDSWAPQVAILNHISVGGFVTHCGWNSLLEAICAGVPMLTWPLYAEQKMNKVLVENMKIALPLDMDESSSEDRFVSATELESRVRELMESDAGMEVRVRIKLMRDGAAAAVKEGGCSIAALNKLVQSWD